MGIPPQVLEKEVYPLVKGFKDTPFIVYMLKARAYAATGEGYIERVYFEQEVGFNRHWLQAIPHSPFTPSKPRPACSQVLTSL